MEMEDETPPDLLDDQVPTIPEHVDREFRSTVQRQGTPSILDQLDAELNPRSHSNGDHRSKVHFQDEPSPVKAPKVSCSDVAIQV